VTGSTLPFRQFVLKVHSRCDLACDHCYIYEHADSSWRGRPKVIASGTIAKAGERIAEHARRHGLSGVRVVLHGGEPLLAGASRLGEMARQLRRAISPVCALDLRVHTNGVRLDGELCEVFLAEGVKVGISLDGDRTGNDRHRRYKDGRSSYDQVIAAVGLLRTDRYRELYAGLLCTIDVRNDPVETYGALAALEPPAVDFLLPHATWDSPPPGAGAGTPYADWLAAAFDAWLTDGRRVPVRIFESIIRTSRGAASLTEALGLEASDLAVIETDGTIEQADSIKVAYDGAPATGLDIFSHELSAAAAHPGIRARQLGIDGLSATCRQCPVVMSCGGGLYAHRYRAGHGFDNPSVYCADLEKIITHVQARLRPATSAAAQRRPPAHELPAAHFDALAGGYGDAESVAQLINAQRSLRRVLLRLLRDRARAGADDGFLAAWTLLVRLEKEHPAALDLVLAHPYVRAWAEHCLRGPGDIAALPADAGHLAAIVAAAAISAGATAEIEVPVSAGHLHLPTLGRLRVGDARTAEITTGGAVFQVRTASGKWDVRLTDSAPRLPPSHPGDWQPVRELRAGGRTVRLEDTDPYRDCHQWPAAPRLVAGDASRWQERFQVAWRLIESAYPAYAAGLAAGLSTIMPLSGGVPGRDISAAARQAFGAVGVALPADGDTMALLLIHEFQHVKLGAVLDEFELCDASDRRLFYAPWRDDPRPVEALLQGTYAHIGVTDYWRVRRHHTGGAVALAAAERFARWRMLTAEAIETLAGAGVLTALGTRFVDGMRATVEPWLAEPVPAAAAAAARRWADDRREVWHRHRGVLPPMGDGSDAARRAGEPPVTRARLARDLRRLGVNGGQTLLVHASLRSVGWVKGGAGTVVGILRDAVGGDGNLVVPAATEANSRTSRAHRARTAGMTSEQVRKYLSEMPAFDPDTTPSGAGAIAEAVRRSTGAVRSAHPQSSFAALGPAADLLMDDHQLESHLGEYSPLAKLYKHENTHVLLLGVGYKACTALHLAEYRYTPNPRRQTYSCVVSDGGKPRWVAYRDVVLDDHQFGAIGDYLDAELRPRRDYVGHAESRLFPLREAVNYATKWMRLHRS